MAIRWAKRATGWALAATSACLVLGACGSSHKTVVPTFPTGLTTTTIVGNSPSDVVGWVTPTLNNGIAFVNAVPAGAPSTQLIRAAQSLSTACVVSERELQQTTWTGQALTAKSALASTLTQTVTLIAKPPATGFAAALHSATATVSQQLKILGGEVHS